MSGQVHVLGSPKYNPDRIHTHTDPNMNVYWNGILQSSRKIEEQTDSNGRCREKSYWSVFYRETLDWLEEWEWEKMDDWVGETRDYFIALATNENLINFNLVCPICLRSIRNPSYRRFMWQTARSKCFCLFGRFDNFLNISPSHLHCSSPPVSPSLRQYLMNFVETPLPHASKLQWHFWVSSPLLCPSFSPSLSDRVAPIQIRCHRFVWVFGIPIESKGLRFKLIFRSKPNAIKLMTQNYCDGIVVVSLMKHSAP